MKILVAFGFILLISNAVGYLAVQHTYETGLAVGQRPSLLYRVVSDENDNKVIWRFLIFSN